MKKVISLLIVLVIVMMTACQSGNVIRPLYEKVDMKNLPDGIYPVEFTKDSIISEHTIKMKIFSEDLYDTLDMHNMKVGDSIEKAGKVEKITKIVRDDKTNAIAINYWDSVDDADECFVPAESGGIFLVKGPDDHGSFTKRGEASIKISDKCVTTDAYEFGKTPNVYNGVKQTIDFIKGSNSYFICLNTTIRIENGECVEIKRRYIP